MNPPTNPLMRVGLSAIVAAKFGINPKLFFSQGEFVPTCKCDRMK
jgi:hypothetical protein